MAKKNGSLQGQQNTGSVSNICRSGITLVQQQYTDINEDLLPGDDGRTFDIVCYNWNRRGYYTSNCPDSSNRVGVSNLQCGHILSQIRDTRGLVPYGWIFLDNCCIDNAINNHELVENLRKCNKDKTLKTYTNGGDLTYEEMRVFKFLPLDVHFNQCSIANVQSLKQVDKMPGGWGKDKEIPLIQRIYLLDN